MDWSTFTLPPASPPNRVCVNVSGEMSANTSLKVNFFPLTSYSSTSTNCVPSQRATFLKEMQPPGFVLSHQMVRYPPADSSHQNTPRPVTSRAPCFDL